MDISKIQASDRLLPQKIHRISVPTPFPVGDVNVYIILDDKVVLVDTGPKTDIAYQTLESGLSNIGLNFADLDEIWLTHGHPDHFGLAVRIAEQFDVKIIGPADEDCNFKHEMDLSKYSRFYREGGIPERYERYAQRELEWYQSFSDPIEMTVPVREGDSADSGHYQFQVISLPGHSPGHIAFLEKSGSLLGGDVLLEHISSNAVIAFNREKEGRRDSLAELRTSMKRAAGLSNCVLPGHGIIFDNVKEIAAKHLNMQEKRYQKIIGSLNIPMNLFEITRHIFPDAQKPEVTFLAVSEVIGYLDWGLFQGKLSKSMQNGIWYYETV